LKSQAFDVSVLACIQSDPKQGNISKNGWIINLSMLPSLRVFNQIPNRATSQKWLDHKSLNASVFACIQSNPEQGNISEMVGSQIAQCFNLCVYNSIKSRTGQHLRNNWITNLSMLQSLRAFNQIPNRATSKKWLDHKSFNASVFACIQSDPK
jgi:hypothetical protein